MADNQYPIQQSDRIEAKSALTPHELYNYHILHPNEPITDEDIRNLKIDSGGVYKDHQLTKEEATENKAGKEKSEVWQPAHADTTDIGAEHPKESPYNILGGS